MPCINTTRGLIKQSVAVRGGYDAGYLAHELKHGFQFENGQMSYYDIGLGGPLHDKEDERESFIRGAAFGDKRSIEDAMTRDYKDLPDGPINLDTPNPHQPKSWRAQMTEYNKIRLESRSPIVHYFIGWQNIK